MQRGVALHSSDDGIVRIQGPDQARCKQEQNEGEAKKQVRILAQENMESLKQSTEPSARTATRENEDQTQNVPILPMNARNGNN